MRRQLDRHLFLVGFMGVGKTRVGGLVARRLGAPLIDLDRRVEAAAHMQISDIFKRYGETYFRELEHVSLQCFANQAPTVVATGGGTFTFERNRQVIKILGLSLWIDVDFDTIIGRMSERGRRARPLLQDERRARALFSARQASYRDADFRIETKRGQTAESVADRIVELIREKNCVTS